MKKQVKGNDCMKVASAERMYIILLQVYELRAIA